MVHYHNFEQLSEEWFEFKKDKMSASHATAVGANGKGLQTYCMEIAMQIVGVTKEQYTNSDMERGEELESIARSAYEFETGYKVHQVGCITNDKYKNVCVSPDGLIGDEGGCEIKARNNIKHFQLIQGIKADVPVNQIQKSLLVSERKWWDYVSYNPNFTISTVIIRHYPDFDYFKKLEQGIDTGNELIEQYVKNYQNFKNIIK